MPCIRFGSRRVVYRKACLCLLPLEPPITNSLEEKTRTRSRHDKRSIDTVLEVGGSRTLLRRSGEKHTYIYIREHGKRSIFIVASLTCVCVCVDFGERSSLLWLLLLFLFITQPPLQQYHQVGGAAGGGIIVCVGGSAIHRSHLVQQPCDRDSTAQCAAHK